jgi:hypothetical protein
MFIVVTSPRFTRVYVDDNLSRFQEPTPETRLIFLSFSSPGRQNQTCKLPAARVPVVYPLSPDEFSQSFQCFASFYLIHVQVDTIGPEYAIDLLR